VFSEVFNILRERCTLPNAHVSSKRACQHHMEEQENILEMVKRSPITSTRRLSTRLCVSGTRVRRTLHGDGLYLFYPQRVQNLNPRVSAIRLEFCHWLHNNDQLLLLILFNYVDTLTLNGINNTRNCHQWSHENPNGINL
jgi:hypothetical protein